MITVYVRKVIRKGVAMTFLVTAAIGYAFGLMFSLWIGPFQAWWKRKFGTPKAEIASDYPAKFGFIFAAVDGLRALWQPKMIDNACGMLLMALGALCASYTVDYVRKRKQL